MATDVQARSDSSSAMTMALIAIVLLVVGAVAYFTMGNRPIETPSTTTVVTQPAAPDIKVEAPKLEVPPVIIDKSAPSAPSSAPSGSSSSTAPSNP